jgi:hypothetical protein
MLLLSASFSASARREASRATLFTFFTSLHRAGEKNLNKNPPRF